MNARGRRTQRRQQEHRWIGLPAARLERAERRRERETERIARELSALRSSHRSKGKRAR